MPVSVVVPFRGSAGAATSMAEALGSLNLGPGDELIVADNGGAESIVHVEGIQVVPAPEQRSSYYARNVGSALARNDWILFVDGDCLPEPDLLDRYFQPHPSAATGAVAGEVVGDPAQEGMLSGWARTRHLLSQEQTLRHRHKPAAVTANLLVRRDAWRSVGGFQEGVRSGGDGEFCWRLQEAGWGLEHRPLAAVRHRHREELAGLWRQMVRHSAGAGWLQRRRPGAAPARAIGHDLMRAVCGVLLLPFAGRFRRALFKAIDGFVSIAHVVGRLRSNAAIERLPAGSGGLVVMADCYPRISETFVREEVMALARSGLDVRVEATTRPERPLLGGARSPRVDYVEDDSLTARLLSLLTLLTAAPGGCLRDLRDQRRWRASGEDVLRLAAIAPLAQRLRRGGERIVHVHFAGPAALTALRLKRLTGVRYSVTAHAREIFVEPRLLAEKLEGADLILTGCDYNVRHLRKLLPGLSDRIHEVVMGVDPGKFSRGAPHTEAPSIVAVGRLVEKKGFGCLIEAMAIVAERIPEATLTICGDGPLRASFDEQIDAAGLSDRIALTGALQPEQVRERLEQAALLVMPSVIAADGDRDSMPVVVKEALAMEVPVVASDEVGLPEAVDPRWGRLAAPGDPGSLAACIEAVLSRTPEERRRMGSAGRTWVVEHADVDREAAFLRSLLEGVEAG